MNEIVTGWLAPNGIFHKCGFMEHLSQAEWLNKYYYNEDIYATGDDFLLLKGFAKITNNYVFIGSIDIKKFTFTDKQIKTLNQLNLTESQKKQVSLILESEDLYPKCEIYKGDENLTAFIPKRVIHTLNEYPAPTKHIKITSNVPVAKEFKPIIGQIYPVIKEGGTYDHLYFILVNGEEVGIYPYRECELVTTKQ